MSIIGRLKAGVEGLFGVTFLHGTSNSYGDAWRKGIEGLFGSLSFERPYAQHPVIHQAVSTVAADTASIKWQAFPIKKTLAKKASPLDTHPILEFLERPALGATSKQLLEATVIHYLLDGECYWYYPDVVIYPEGMPDAAKLEGGGIVFYRSTDVVWERNQPILTATRVPLDVAKLTCFKRYNPYARKGISVVETFEVDARADMGASKWNEHMLADRNGLPNIVLMPPPEGGGTPQQRKEVKEKWESSFAKGRSGVGVTPPGWDLKELGGSRKEMEFALLRSGARETILAGVGLVPFLAGVLDKANYANAREQKMVYWRGTIARLLSMIEDIINHDFLPKLGVRDVQLFPQWEMVRAMADDVEQKSRIAASWFALGLSKKVINEALEMGWDEEDIEDYEQGYLPINFIPAGLAGDTIYTPPVPSSPPEPGKELPAKVSGTAAQAKDRRLNLWRVSVMRLRVLERPVESLMRSIFRDIEKEVLAKVGSLAGLNAVSRERDRAKLANDESERASDVNNLLFDDVRATRDLLDRISPRIRAALVTGGETVLIDAGLNIKFNPDDLRLASKLLEQQVKVRNIIPTVREHLRETLSEGLAKGESASQMADRVVETMDAARSRAMTIARTEMGTAYSNGRTIGMKQAGIQRHEWLSAKDDAVRPSHEIDGEDVAIGEPFSNGLIQPLDPEGLPEEVINCRCTTLPVVSEE